jgi:Rod binding domain-containing protein
MAGIDLTAALAASVRAETATEAQKKQADGPQHQRLRKATRDMETWFVSTLLKKMHASASSDGLLGQSQEANTYREMFDDAIAKEIGNRGAFGIADSLYRVLATHVNEEVK